MEGNERITHGLHWLTQGADGWQCAHPDCAWHFQVAYRQTTAQRIFDQDHAKLSEPEVSVQT